MQRADTDAWPGVTGPAVQGRNKGLGRLRREPGTYSLSRHILLVLSSLIHLLIRLGTASPLPVQTNHHMLL